MIDKQLAKDLMVLVHRPEWSTLEKYLDQKKEDCVRELTTASDDKLARLAEAIKTYDNLLNLKVYAESMYKEHKSKHG